MNYIVIAHERKHYEPICGDVACQTWAALRGDEKLVTWSWVYHQRQADKTLFCPVLPEEIQAGRLMDALGESIRSGCVSEVEAMTDKIRAELPSHLRSRHD